jgi:hypothetical protein
VSCALIVIGYPAIGSRRRRALADSSAIIG